MTNASGDTEYRLASTALEARLSARGVLVEILEKSSGQRFVMDAPEQFRVLTGDRTIGPADCDRPVVTQHDGRIELVYPHPDFEISVSYRLGPDDHFLDKVLKIRPRGNASYTLKHVSMGKWRQAADSGTLVPFPHGQCLTYFLRRPGAGFFFGVRTPFDDAPKENAVEVDLSYRVGIIFPPGTTYEAEPAYFGVYRPIGRCAPPVPARIKESVLSQIPPDAGESEAMLRMVKKLAPPRGGLTLTYCGYQGGLYYGDYGEPDGMARVEEDKETLRLVHEMLGPCIVQAAGPFFGAFRDAMRLSTNDQRLPATPARQELVDWINANGMTAMHWACLKAVHGYDMMKPRLGPYCPDHPEWHADQYANCTAHPDYMNWFTKLLSNDIKAGYAGFFSDEPGPGLRYQLRCEKSDHPHLPGDVSYAYFYRRREFFRTLRRTFGEQFELQGQRPHMDAGIWDATYLNSLFTFLENPGLKAETFRLWSRMRRCYSFVPSYLDQIMVQPGFEPVDHTMLSALAVSSNYLFIAPSAKEKLKAHKHAVDVNDHRVLATALREFPAPDRQRVRFWLDWARQHAAYMDEVIDLADWPGNGKPDGYLRLRDGRGYAFLFNSSGSFQSIQVPLDQSVGLDGKRRYSLKQLFPCDPQPGLAGQSSVSVTLAPASASLFEITPVSQK